MEPQNSRRYRRPVLVVLVSCLALAALVFFVGVVTGWGVLMLGGAVAFGVVGVLHYFLWGRREERAAMPRHQDAEGDEAGGNVARTPTKDSG